ncbi:zinc-dependent peptidase [Aquisphaera insulae]|uniref:M90 family metallopeptidase n=1 Tax=Aquisphaera insulae TaxID=2712864 RepID=UPI0013ECDE98|nr:M90 family metallopeptidase [Aquisphaera insulae]
MFGFLRRRRRERIRGRPLPEEWLRIVRRNVPIFDRLTDSDREELLGHVQVFVEEKYYEGCGGLALTEEIRVTIAAAACILLLHRQTDYFPGLTSILVYPDAYVAPTTTPMGGGLVMEESQIRLGEAWKGGVVVVSWKDLMETAAGRDDGRNLVLHEFAHLLDMEDGAVDGTPVLETRKQYARWSAVMEPAFERLRRDRALGRYSVLDPYGATDPAEFFAVATEAFFEKPGVLRRRQPDLYEELRAFYRQDPDRWQPRSRVALHQPEVDTEELPAVEEPS